MVILAHPGSSRTQKISILIRCSIFEDVFSHHQWLRFSLSAVATVTTSGDTVII